MSSSFLAFFELFERQFQTIYSKFIQKSQKSTLFRPKIAVRQITLYRAVFFAQKRALFNCSIYYKICQSFFKPNQYLPRISRGFYNTFFSACQSFQKTSCKTEKTAPFQRKNAVFMLKYYAKISLRESRAPFPTPERRDRCCTSARSFRPSSLCASNSS